ncbi:MAG: amino acid transporter, partial [Gemmataceae bacterium]|nr:amino acid transporter [Gemmataceae bacterium]
FGMEFRWAHRWSILLVLFALINLLVTLYFQASVDAQRNAYASGVMVLIACAAMVTVLDKSHAWKASPRGFWSFVNLWYFRVLAGGFVLLALAVVVRSFSGLAIAALFIGALLVMSVISRAYRADEMRTIGFDFKDEQSKFLWDSLRMADFPVLVPHRPGRFNREDKEIQIRCEHQLAPDADTVFVEVEVDDPSNFYQKLMIEVVQEDHRFVIKVTRCVSVAHAIAAIAMEMSKLSRPPGVHFGWSEMSLLTASWSYFAFGEGNIPWKVRELIHRNEPDPEKRPRVIVG